MSLFFVPISTAKHNTLFLHKLLLFLGFHFENEAALSKHSTFDFQTNHEDEISWPKTLINRWSANWNFHFLVACNSLFSLFPIEESFSHENQKQKILSLQIRNSIFQNDLWTDEMKITFNSHNTFHSLKFFLFFFDNFTRCFRLCIDFELRFSFDVSWLKKKKQTKCELKNRKRKQTNRKKMSSTKRECYLNQAYVYGFNWYILHTLQTVAVSCKHFHMTQRHCWRFVVASVTFHSFCICCNLPEMKPHTHICTHVRKRVYWQTTFSTAPFTWISDSVP